MKVSIGIGGAASGRSATSTNRSNFVIEAEKLGVDAVWSAEAWGQDAIAPLAYLAARTSRVRLGTGIMQISARVPAMTAMTALTMAAISNDPLHPGPRYQRSAGRRGAAGPAVQGATHPAERNGGRSSNWRLPAKRIEYRGKYHELPLPGGQGKALRLSQPGNANIPIYLATPQTPCVGIHRCRSRWLARHVVYPGTCRCASRLSAPRRRRGRAQAWPTSTLRLAARLRSGDDLDALVEPLKPAHGLYARAMGSATTNFYNDAFKRGGWEAAGREVQRLWVAGKRPEAIAKVPPEMGDSRQICWATPNGAQPHPGPTRMRASRRSRVGPQGRDLAERLTTLGRVMDLVRAVNVGG